MTLHRFFLGALLSVWVSFSTMGASPAFWHTRISPSSSQLNGATYGNGLFVDVGSNTTILTSPNGMSWDLRPAGMTAPTLWCAAFGNGRYVLGGGEGALLLSSTNGVQWTNVLSTIGAENISAITYGYGLFVAVGRNSQANSGYILTSTNGLDWTSRTAPTTNTLFGVAAAIGADGVGWADTVLVAVGDNGTIISSTNGVNWDPRNSGTTVPLRAVVYHQGLLIAGGDSGTVRKSSDGISWTPSAPASFSIRGLASSADDLVAVGNYLTAGRLHASSTGLTWPGFATEFAQPLNGIAFGAGTFVAVGNNGLIVQSAGATNEWTKTTSGYWEEAFWSLGRLPGVDEVLVAFGNPGFKALAIGTNTTANFASSLSIENLLVESPANSLNQLLLNYAGVNVPLFVSSDFVLGPNASLVSYDSAVQGGRLLLSSPASFSVGSTIAFSNIIVGANAPAQLNITNSMLAGNLLILSQNGTGTVNQSGGSNVVIGLRMFAGSVYNLADGTVATDRLEMQSLGGMGLAQFNMGGGSMAVCQALRLGRTFFTPDARGEFFLGGGSFRCVEMDFLNGKFTQTGGTNVTQKMALPQLDNSHGEYFLQGGLLISSNIVLGAVLNPSTPAGSANFVQSGGVHTNTSMTLFGDIRHQTVTHFGSYTLNTGLLASDSIRLIGGVISQTGGTNCTRQLSLEEGGLYVLSLGTLVTSNTTVDTCCCVMSEFIQISGNHTVRDRLLLTDFVRYKLNGGTLNVSNFDLSPGGELRVTGGTISNSGLFTLRSGGLEAVGNHTLELGKLQVIGEAISVCFSTQPLGSTIDFGLFDAGATVLKFRDSRDVAWSGGPLSILHWRGSTNGGGPQHIFVGTNSEGLTAAQLSQVRFVNAIGLPPGSYGARILDTGELIPAVLPPVLFARSPQGLILTWNTSYELLSATNVTGPYLPVPGAKSPFTNPFTGARRFFILRLAVP